MKTPRSLIVRVLLVLLLCSSVKGGKPKPEVKSGANETLVELIEDKECFNDNDCKPHKCCPASEDDNDKMCFNRCPGLQNPISTRAEDCVDVTYEGRSFKYCKYPFSSWFNALLYCCEHFKGTLAGFRSRKELDFFSDFGLSTIGALINPNGISGLYYPYVGGQKIIRETWLWMDKTDKETIKPTSNMWNTGYPLKKINFACCTNIPVGGTDGIEGLYNTRCKKQRPFICALP